MPFSADVVRRGALTVAWDGASPTTPPAGSTVTIAMPQMGTVTAQLSGTFSATVTWEGMVEENNSLLWRSITAVEITTKVAATTATAAGIYQVNSAGLRQVRARCSTFASGSVTTTLNASTAASGGTVTMADGADAALGGTADGAASSDAGTFSLIALFKRLLQKLTTQFAFFPALFVNIITVVDVTITRPANVTGYTGQDEIVDTGGAVATVAVGRVNGGAGTIEGITCIYSNNPTVTPQLRVLFFDTAPATAGDNNALNLSDADAAKCIGYIDLNVAQAGGSATSANLIYDSGAQVLDFLCAGGVTTLSFLIVTRVAFTPIANSETLKFRFRVRQTS